MKKFFLQAIPLLLGVCITAAIISSFSDEKVKFEEAALGEKTSSYLAKVNGFSIHNSGYAITEDSFLIAGWKQRGSNPVMFFIGNSQTHGINRMKPGEVNYVEMLHQDNTFQDSDVLANSIPNGNLQEFYLIYAYYAEFLPIHTLCIPVFMDDLRETGIREFFFGDLAQVPLSIANDTSDIAKKISGEVNLFQRQESATGDMAALDKTMQAVTEEYLNEMLNQHWPAWSNREQVRGNVFNSLYQFRNTAFGITAQTRRKMVSGTYQENFNALDALLRLATQNRARVVVYVPPLRNDVAPPYDHSEYAEFKRKLEALVRKNGAEFANLEDIVPGPEWGMKASTNASGQPEYDFMHFTADGHRRLAEALRPLLSNTPPQ